MRGYRAKVTAVSDGADAPAGWVKVEYTAAGASFETDWCAFPVLSRGDGFGLWLPPVQGERVLVLFDDDDELREEPEVVRSSWDDDYKPPSSNLEKCVLKLPASVPFEVQIGDIKHQFLNNKLVIDDGGAAEKLLAIAELVVAEISALRDWAASHTHTVGYGGFGAVTSVTSPTSAPPAVGNVATTLVAVKE